MNDLIDDISLLESVKRGIETGVDSEVLAELLDKVIRFKTLQITTFEREMEKEFLQNGIDCP
jgi:hypothetical protein